MGAVFLSQSGPDEEAEMNIIVYLALGLICLKFAAMSLFGRQTKH
jgi:hypothetical protein